MKKYLGLTGEDWRDVFIFMIAVCLLWLMMYAIYADHNWFNSYNKR